MNIELLPNQRKLLESPASLKLGAGGVGGGKTQCGAYFALKQLTDHPMVKGLVCANTYGQLAKSTLMPLTGIMDQMGIKWSFGRKPSWPTNNTEVDWSNVLSIANGAHALCYSAERPEVIRGITVGWVWMDETRDTSEAFWTNVQGRIRDPRGSGVTMVTTTPPGKNHWLFSKFVDEEKKLPNTEVVTLRTRDNYFLPKGYYDKLLADMGSSLAAQELEGEWVVLGQGLVFEFDRKKSCRPCVAQPGLPLMLSLDSNVQPMAGIVLQIDKAKRQVWILDEITIENNALTRRAGEMFASRYSSWRGELLVWVDVTSLKRDTRGGEADILILKQALKPFFPGVREGSDRRIRLVIDGVCAVNALLNPALGEPRLFVDPRCKELIKDFETTTWVEGQRKIDKTNLKRGHWCDAARYPIAQELPVMNSGVITGIMEPSVSKFL